MSYRDQLISFGVAIAMLVAIATPIEASCTSDSKALVEELREGQAGHAWWAHYLEANPQVVYADAGTAHQQWDLVENYESRIRAVQWLEAGSRTWIPWLLSELERGRSIHQEWLDNNYANGFANREWNQHAVSVYDWRIATVNSMLVSC